MNRKTVITGVIFLALGLWFYLALSTFEVEESAVMKRIVVRKGIEMSKEEVAQELAQKAGFDLEGAHAMGYSTYDIIEYLMNAPVNTSITVSGGKFYFGRETVAYMVPFSGTLLFLIFGTFLVLLGLLRKR